MKRRIVLALAVLVALLVAGSGSAASAEDPVVPFKVSYQCLPQVVGVVDNCLVQQLPCQGEATHLGESTLYSDARSCFDGSQSGAMQFTAANGDQLFGHFAGKYAGNPGPVTFAGDFWITGGTGRFAGTTGTGAYWGTAEGGNGLFYADGTLTRASE